MKLSRFVVGHTFTILILACSYLLLGYVAKSKNDTCLSLSQFYLFQLQGLCPNNNGNVSKTRDSKRMVSMGKPLGQAEIHKSELNHQIDQKKLSAQNIVRLASFFDTCFLLQTLYKTCDHDDPFPKDWFTYLAKPQIQEEKNVKCDAG